MTRDGYVSGYELRAQHRQAGGSSGECLVQAQSLEVILASHVNELHDPEALPVICRCGEIRWDTKIQFSGRRA